MHSKQNKAEYTNKNSTYLAVQQLNDNNKDGDDNGDGEDGGEHTLWLVICEWNEMCLFFGWWLDIIY